MTYVHTYTCVIYLKYKKPSSMLQRRFCLDKMFANAFNNLTNTDDDNPPRQGVRGISARDENRQGESQSRCEREGNGLVADNSAILISRDILRYCVIKINYASGRERAVAD